MKIIYLWDADYPWDVRTEKICAAIVQGGHEVTIVSRNRGWQASREFLPEGTVHRMPPWSVLGRRADAALSFPAFFNPRWIAHLATTMREIQPDLIIVRDLPLCPTALLVGGRAGVPVILDMAEHYPAMMRAIWVAGRQQPFDFVVRNPALVSAVERFCVKRVAKILVVVKESADRLQKMGVDADRLAIVSNTPPRGHVRARPRSAPAHSSDRPLELLYLGMMEIPRGVGDLLQAMHLLKEAGVRVHLRLVGNGRDLQVFQEMSAQLGLGEEVEFCGYIARAQALKLVESADVGIVPHHSDEAWNATVPNKLFDYMAAGLPVVSSDAGPCVRIVKETRAGLLYRSGDAGDLARAIRKLTDPARRNDLGSAGRKAVLDRYNWERDMVVLLETVEAFGPRPLKAKVSPPAAPIMRSASR